MMLVTVPTPESDLDMTDTLTVIMIRSDAERLVSLITSPGWLQRIVERTRAALAGDPIIEETAD